MVEEAFGPDEGPTVASLVAALDDAGSTRASLGYAEADGQVVGHVQLSRSWVDAREALVDVLVLSPLSVAPAHQRQGDRRRAPGAPPGPRPTGSGRPPSSWRATPATTAGADGPPPDALGFAAPSARIPAPAFQVVAAPGVRALDDGRPGLLRALLGARLRRPARPAARPARRIERDLPPDMAPIGHAERVLDGLA